MGYTILGRVNIVARPGQATAAALLAESIINRYPEAEDMHEEWRSGKGNPIVRALEISGFTDAEYLDDNTEADFQLVADYNGLWWPGMDFVHHLASESGMNVKGSFRGQDYGIIESIAWTSQSGQACVQKQEDAFSASRQ